jgi:ATP-binding protein involved in chromosome partitioning
MKGYHDIAGDGGSRVLEQVAEQRSRITDGLAGVRHLVAVGSGKGGVGKSTLTLHLAGALRARGLRIAILDADFNGPSQARMAVSRGAVRAWQPQGLRSRGHGTGSACSRWAR